MTTEKQKKAVAFCERWLHIKFRGSLNDYKKVSSFLSEHLELAKDMALEAYCDWSAEYGY